MMTTKIMTLVFILFFSEAHAFGQPDIQVSPQPGSASPIETLLSPGGEARSSEAAVPSSDPTAKEKVDIKPLKDKEPADKDVKELSQTEKIMSGHFPKQISRELLQFGYDFFDKVISTFTPVSGSPVGDDYIIGPGDGFVVHLWGNVEETQKALVTRDGQVILPRLGTLTVSGMTFAELKKFLESKYRQFFPDFQISVTMESLRSLEVFIVGEVKAPGTYSVSSLSTVITALYAAGGPTKNGSLRNIKLFRNGRLVQLLDLYLFFIEGFKEDDVRLEPGDTLLVPVIGPVAGIAGNVRRPAIYEIKTDTIIAEVIWLAGGVLPSGQLQNVVIERIDNHQKRIVRSFNIDPAFDEKDQNLRIPIKDGDVVKIYPVHDRIGQVVYLEGHVKYPMEHELKPGMRLKDLLASYKDLLPEAHLSRAEIVRLIPPDLHPEIVPFSPEGLLSGDESQNLELKDMDRVIIYAAGEKADLPKISIKGEVRNEGTYPLYPGMTVKDLIFAAGNLTRKAYLKKATLTRVVTTEKGADSLKLDFSIRDALEGSSRQNLALKQDDVVVIHQIPNYTETLTRKVTLEGAFAFPGEYSFSEGEQISSVIERAGGLASDAYPYGAVFLRETVKDVQRKQVSDYISRLEEDILSSESYAAEILSDKEQAAGFQQALIAKKQLIQKLKTAKPTGRMVIDLEEIMASPSSKYNFELKPGDHLIVEKHPNHVNVLGEAVNPTALYAEEGKKVDFYIDRVGGVTRNADKAQMYIVRANGTVISKHQSGFFGLTSWDSDQKRWYLGGFDSIEILPGDTIIIPQKTDKYRNWTLTKDIVDVAYKVAVAAGVIIVAY